MSAPLNRADLLADMARDYARILGSLDVSLDGCGRPQVSVADAQKAVGFLLDALETRGFVVVAKGEVS